MTEPLTLERIDAVENLCVLVQETGDFADAWLLPALCSAARAHIENERYKLLSHPQADRREERYSDYAEPDAFTVPATASPGDEELIGLLTAAANHRRDELIRNGWSYPIDSFIEHKAVARLRSLADAKAGLEAEYQKQVDERLKAERHERETRQIYNEAVATIASLRTRIVTLEEENRQAEQRGFLRGFAKGMGDANALHPYTAEGEK